MERTLLVLGAGGHGKAVAESAVLSGHWQRVAFVDDRWPELQTCIGWPVVSNMVGLSALSGQYRMAIPAVGNNAVREQWFQIIDQAGLELAIVIHPTASVSANARIGRGCAIMALSVIGVEAEIGEGAIVNAHGTVDHDATLGRFAHIGVGVHLAGGVQIGDRAWLQAGSCAGYNVVVAEGEIYPPGTVLSKADKRIDK